MTTRTSPIHRNRKTLNDRHAHSSLNPLLLTSQEVFDTWGAPPLFQTIVRISET